MPVYRNREMENPRSGEGTHSTQRGAPGAAIQSCSDDIDTIVKNVSHGKTVSQKFGSAGIAAEKFLCSIPPLFTDGNVTTPETIAMLKNRLPIFIQLVENNVLSLLGYMAEIKSNYDPGIRYNPDMAFQALLNWWVFLGGDRSELENIVNNARGKKYTGYVYQDKVKNLKDIIFCAPIIKSFNNDVYPQWVFYKQIQTDIGNYGNRDPNTIDDATKKMMTDPIYRGFHDISVNHNYKMIFIPYVQYYILTHRHVQTSTATQANTGTA